ncbi:hypothetical protein OIE66_00310 [Nonomuraea sp. NBC_01738]|uniref:hypothetical protein n=1 Tax=Nonomuraea sp. NBC_01738 TaxID=2976003 RepID=UPI002E112F1C|nr:hypothetical protein OIE66_00310 [Nonomuraea sp. NBC_01738]
MNGELAGLRVRDSRLRVRREELLALLRPPAPGSAVVPEGAGAPEMTSVASGAGGRTGAPTANAGAAPVAGAQGAFAAGGGPGGPGGPQAGVPGGPGGPGGGPGAYGPEGPVPGAGEVSPRTAQNSLLILGGLLLTVAAVVFTLVSWGHMGIAGRGLVLAAVTGIALFVPWVLIKRGLGATAETVGVLALALLMLDGYAAHRVGALASLGWADYWGVVLALVAAVSAVYGRVLPLRVQPVIAVVLAQLPLVIWLDDTAVGFGIAFTAATGFNVALWKFGKSPALRITSGICLGVTVIVAFFVAAVDSVVVDDDILACVGLLAVQAGLGLWMAWRAGVVERVAGVGFAALTLTFALGSPVSLLLDDAWRVLPYPVAALVVAGAAVLLPRASRATGVIAGVVLAGLAAVPFVPELLVGLSGPLGNAASVWDGAASVPDGLFMVRAGVVTFALFAVVCGAVGWKGVALLGPLLTPPPQEQEAQGAPAQGEPAQGESPQEAPATGAPAQGVLAWGWFAGWGVREWTLLAGLVFWTLAALVAPVAFGAPYLVGAGVALALTVLLSVLAARTPVVAWAAAGAAVQAVAWGLVTEGATYAVLGALLVVWGVFYRRPAALTGAALAGGGLVWAVLGGLGAEVAGSVALGFAVAGALALAGAFASPEVARNGGAVPQGVRRRPRTAAWLLRGTRLRPRTAGRCRFQGMPVRRGSSGTCWPSCSPGWPWPPSRTWRSGGWPATWGRCSTRGRGQRNCGPSGPWRSSRWCSPGPSPCRPLGVRWGGRWGWRAWRW